MRMDREKAIQDVSEAMRLVTEIQWAMLLSMSSHGLVNRHEIGTGYKVLMGVWGSLNARKHRLESCALECCS